MKTILKYSLLLALLVPCRTLFSKPKLSDFKSDEDKLTLKPGEKLVYSIRWGRIPVGTATMRVKEIKDVDGKKVYHIESTAKSNSFISVFYKVRDVITSYVEVEGFRPLKFDKSLHEGKRDKEESIEFDWEKKEATYYKGKGDKRVKRRTITIKEQTQDPLSCVYFFRNMDMKVGEECTMSVTTERKCWDVAFKPLREQKLRLRGLGTFDTIVIEPSAEFEGLFVHDKKMTIWLDKETKIPLLILADIPIGSARLTLSKIEDTSSEKKDEAVPKKPKRREKPRRQEKPKPPEKPRRPVPGQEKEVEPAPEKITDPWKRIERPTRGGRRDTERDH